MKLIADSRAALTSNRKDTIDVISVLKSWKKLSSIAKVSLLSFGLTFTLFNTIAIKALALETATAINITQQYTATKAETKQGKSDRQYPTLRRNPNPSQQVKYLQRRLSEWGYYKQTINGIFGPVTEAAVRQFQLDRDIFPSGIVDAQTWDAIEKRSNYLPSEPGCNRTTLQPGSEGKDVRDLQQRLYDLGYLKIRPRGYFGEATKLALIRFQQQQDLPATGTVNARTWKALRLSCNV